jgi:hypothetical protein
MSSETKILRTQNGVTLKKVMLFVDAGPIAISYSVSSKRTPEVWQAANLEDANGLFEDELARCSKPT